MFFFFTNTKEKNDNESCHAYSEFESNFDDSETELRHADSESGLINERAFFFRKHKLLTIGLR